jgi:hypothetical protein
MSGPKMHLPSWDELLALAHIGQRQIVALSAPSFAARQRHRIVRNSAF